MLDFAEEVLRNVPESKSKIIFKPLPQDDPKQRRPDITRARTILGWEPMIDRAEGLKRTLEYFRKVVVQPA